MHDTYPPLPSSANSNQLHPNFHHRNLYITLPATNSVDNRDCISARTNLVMLRHSMESQPTSSITNAFNLCRSGSNQAAQNHPTSVVQQEQQSYHQIPGPFQSLADNIQFIDTSLNSLNDTNQNAVSVSQVATSPSTEQANVIDSGLSRNGENESQSLPTHS